jgi:hypothetical protein
MVSEGAEKAILGMPEVRSWRGSNEVRGSRGQVLYCNKGCASCGERAREAVTSIEVRRRLISLASQDPRLPDPRLPA